jgi:hypothetical protein
VTIAICASLVWMAQLAAGPDDGQPIEIHVDCDAGDWLEGAFSRSIFRDENWNWDRPHPSERCATVCVSSKSTGRRH